MIIPTLSELEATVLAHPTTAHDLTIVGDTTSVTRYGRVVPAWWGRALAPDDWPPTRALLKRWDKDPGPDDLDALAARIDMSAGVFAQLLVRLAVLGIARASVYEARRDTGLSSRHDTGCGCLRVHVWLEGLLP